MKLETFYEADIIKGLEALALKELQGQLGSTFKLLQPVDRWDGILQFGYTGDPRNLLQLKTIVSIFTVQHFPVPRPKALLGHQNHQLLIDQLIGVRNLLPKGSYRSFYLAAAGSDSSIMLRLRRELASTLGMRISDEEGDLLLRLRRPRDGSDGWESVVRLSPRPLSVRNWRVCDYEGALNASAAQAMVTLTNPTPQDVFLNLACGSGTLLVERLSAGPARMAIGCDLDPAALQCAYENIFASPYSESIQVYPWDARALPLGDASIDVFAADLPFGLDVGSHKDNEVLYPQLLSEAARVAKPLARLVLMSQEVKMMQSLLENSTQWMVDRVLTVTIAGLHPRIFVLRRST